MDDEPLQQALSLEAEARELGEAGDDRGAQVLFLRMKAILVERAGAMPGDLQALRFVAGADRWLSLAAENLGDYPKAKKHAGQAYRLCKAQCRGDPMEPYAERAHLASCRRMAHVLIHMGRHDAAVTYAREAVSLGRWLVTIPYEDDEDVHPQLASALDVLGWALWELDRLHEALSAYNEVLELAEGLDPLADDGWADRLSARTLSNVGEILRKLRRLNEARVSLDEAISRLEARCRVIGATSGASYDLGIAHRRAGLTAAGGSDLARAVGHLEHAVRHAREAVRGAPENETYPWGLYHSLCELALIRQRQGEVDTGRALAAEAIELKSRL